MNHSGQSAGVFLIIILAVVVIGFLYFEGYLSFPIGTSQSGTPSSPVPISVSGSLSSPSVYTNQNFSFIAQISNSWTVPVTVSAIPYGCPFITASSKDVSIFPNASSTLSWSFSSPSQASCQIQVTACFNATSHAYYPFTIKNATFTGSVPTSSPTFGIAPLSISLNGFNPVFQAYPTKRNQTLYVGVAAASTVGNVKNGTLKWLDIAINGHASLSLQLIAPSGLWGPYYDTNINITQQGANSAFIQFGSINIPLYIGIPNTTPQGGFYSDNSLNITAGYEYCVTSLPVSVSIQ